ncbi:MAG: nucleoside monophosphate kinase [Candidatus Moranbacteria bacterium]|nr:nucleoside monophosphate kinase [Candidatus Moranbacteria bacterium]NTW75654.1 nucleoside monophosphate kinase [Candidatus Moranbacteria bacterium]
MDSHPDAYILLGPPGSGKSTQADLFGREFGAVHIDMGAALRAAAGERTPFGEALSDIINKRRELVPDGIVRSILENELKRIGASRPVIIDGAPRRESQIHSVLSAIHGSSRELRKAIFIDLSEAGSVARISRRFSCASCGRKLILGSDLFASDKPCPFCGGVVSQRADDTEEGVRTRYRIFREDTLPVISHFREKGTLLHVSGDRNADVIFREIANALQEV